MTRQVCNDDLLKMLYPIKSIPLDEVARRVGYANHGNVTRRAVELGLPKRTDTEKTAKRNDAIRAAVAKGISITQIASLHKLSIQRIRSIASGDGMGADAGPKVKIKAGPESIAAALAKAKAAKEGRA